MSLQKHLHPKDGSWSKFKDPVCILVYSLYGHPRAGQFWEKHAEAKLKSVGYVSVPNWPSVFFNPQTKLMLVVYVDDFLMSGPEEFHEQAWKDINNVIKLDNPRPLDRFLGCQHVITKTETGSDCRFEMLGYLEQSISMYLEYTGTLLKDLKNVPTPFVDQDSLTDQDWVEQGELDGEALALLMKVLYCARLARPDLLRPVNELGRHITKWSRACDKQLHRLFHYIHSSKHHVLVTSMGDDINDLQIELFTDADLASEKADTKSTNGFFCVMSGPTSNGVCAYGHKRQTCTALGTPEAEIVSLNHGLKNCGLPMKDLWEFILQRPVRLLVHEDNETCITIVKKGYSPQLRYLDRTQRTKISWLHEVIHELREADMEHCDTAFMRADIFTKRIKPCSWKDALDLIFIRTK